MRILIFFFSESLLPYPFFNLNKLLISSIKKKSYCFQKKNISFCKLALQKKDPGLIFFRKKKQICQSLTMVHSLGSYIKSDVNER